MKVLRFVAALVEDYIPAVILAATTILVMTDVIGRYAFNHPFIGVSELALIGMVWLVFLGAVGVMRRREHIALELILERLGARGQAIMDSITHVIMTAVLGTLLYLSVKFVTTTVFSSLVVTGLSRRFMATSVVIMVALMLLIVLGRTIRAIRGIFVHDYDRNAGLEASLDDVPPSI